MQIPRAGSMQIPRLLQSPQKVKALTGLLISRVHATEKILKCYKYVLRCWRGKRCCQHDTEKPATGIETCRASAQGRGTGFLCICFGLD